jgi:hypothetical protein
LLWTGISLRDWLGTSLRGQIWETGVANDVEILLAEYNNCAEVANHVDNVRNVITSFFLTLNGGILIFLSLVTNRDVQSETFGSPRGLLAGLMLGVSTLGMVFTGTVARLRRVQTERYRIANGILDHLLTPEARGIIPLANGSLSSDAGGSGLGKRTTGSYLWTLAIMLPTAGLAGLAGYYIAADIHDAVSGPLSWLGAVALSALVLIVEDTIYFRLASFHAAPIPEAPTGDQRS